MAAYTSIDNPELYFQDKAYTGNGSTSHAITLDGSENMQPDMIWIKCRSAAENHSLSDSVRGDSGAASGFYNLTPNTNDLEYGGAGNEYVGAIGSDGFTVGSNDVVNTNTETYVAFCWKETATAGFDIVTATGNATAKTISHSLSAVPHVIIAKEKTGSANDWVVYHHKNTSAPETDKLILNENNATSDDSCWNDTSPTSSVFSVSSATVVNRDSSTYVYYLWRGVQGFSAMGSYTGNGNDNGVYVHLGFRPSWFMCKRTDSANTWNIMDNKRDPHNEVTLHLSADDPHADETSTSDSDFDFCANGIKIREGNNGCNGSGATYIYLAFAEAPFVNSNGVPCNAR